MIARLQLQFAIGGETKQIGGVPVDHEPFIRVQSTATNRTRIIVNVQIDRPEPFEGRRSAQLDRFGFRQAPIDHHRQILLVIDQIVDRLIVFASVGRLPAFDQLNRRPQTELMNITTPVFRRHVQIRIGTGARPPGEFGQFLHADDGHGAFIDQKECIASENQKTS